MRKTIVVVMIVLLVCFYVSDVFSAAGGRRVATQTKQNNHDDDDPFADEVLDFSPGPGGGSEAQLALGAPASGGTESAPDNTSIVLLGDGGELTLKFNTPVIDDPDNPDGYDFIVFGNPFFVNENPGQRWQEPCFVEISKDENGNGIADDEWYLILPRILPSDLTDEDVGESGTILMNYGEYTPTVGDCGGTREYDFTYPTPQGAYHVREYSGGGDAMKIEDAVVQAEPGVPALDIHGNPIPANIDEFSFIRLTDARVGDLPNTAEIDAVSDVSTRNPYQVVYYQDWSKGDFIYVPDDYPTIQEAIDAAEANDSVLVREGYYYVDDPDPTEPTLRLKSKVRVVGNPQEPHRVVVERTGADNSYAVIAEQDVVDAYLIGCTVKGYNGIRVGEEGSGDTAKALISNCIVYYTGNTGIKACGSSKARIVNNSIVGVGSEAIKCTDEATPWIVNNIITHNQRGIVVGENAEPKKIANNNLWNNNINYEGIEDQTGINGNISEDPEYIDYGNQDYRLSYLSECQGAGESHLNMGAYASALVTPDGYRVSTFKLIEGSIYLGGMCALSDGDIVYFDGRYVKRVDTNLDGLPQEPHVLFDLGVQGFGTSLRLDPEGKYAYLCTTSDYLNYEIYKIDIIQEIGEVIDVIQGVFDLAINGLVQYFLSATVEGFGTDNKILYWNPEVPENDIIADMVGPSGPIVFDSQNNMFYCESTFEYPPPPDSHRILKFTASQVENAVNNPGQNLTPDDALEYCVLDSGFNLAFDKDDNLFASDLNGKILKVRQAEFEAVAESGNSQYISFTYLDAFKDRVGLGPFSGQTAGKLFIVGSDYANFSDLYAITAMPGVDYYPSHNPLGKKCGLGFRNFKFRLQ